MKLPSVVRFAEDNIKATFYQLENGDLFEKELLKFINQAMDNLEEDAYCGIQIPKRLIPKTYLQKYQVTNLWKYDLPRGWRLIYTIKNEQVTVISLILEWLDHKEYERRFSD
jgi:Txe/YoeB family toxin of Txe-Axe toxin-antitoxin module